ncbi:hypothetical protein IAT38_004168 [Cryptococcus sp. DSM 104549]
MSTEKRTRTQSDAEKGQAGSTTSRSPNRQDDFFNYHPPFGVVVIEFLVWLFLFFVCFLSPNGGLSTVVKGDKEYVGLLRKCTETSCDGWMASSSSGTSSSDTPAAAASRRSLTPRAIDSSLNLSDFYLTTGLAALSCFWLMTYAFLFTLHRFFTSPPPPYASDDDDESKSLGRWARMRRGYKRFVYRVGRIYVFMLGWIVLGVACAASWQIKLASGDGGGIGMGVLLLHASWILLFICTYLEISRGALRKRADLGWASCTCLPFFDRCKVRATKKWDGRDEDGDEDEEGDSRRRGKSRDRGRKGRRDWEKEEAGRSRSRRRA